ncbi:SRPBCC family protein [Kitasatospora cheerisanensis]|uniref:Activator of HSP90 ATPase n=1 Tax=Kitasatospora cheerisanensis KCTC 2395 TaxID=1348663 RepID=A0A066YJJ4_9ACTN|nr:SRPBCC domain-containing protein [Kitasatospora cheerisanensis]KDN81332.1 activator of HSP90 ATPase [Kitasatospora cheerisanensis KCTC 2395]
MTHPFEITQEIVLPADPEQVWEAIATGPGIESWFMGRNEVEPREGGAAAMDVGGNREEALITAYEPGKRFATRTGTAADGRFMAFEYLIEGRGGGSTVLRVVHSGMLGDDWEDEYDALRRGWPFHLHTLREYLAHFPGRTGRPVFAMAQTGERPGQEVRAALAGGLSLPAAVTVGARAQAEPAGLPPLAGEVTWADEERFEVRTGDGLFTFHQAPGLVLMFHHLFDSGAPAGPDAEAGWASWLAGVLA